MCIWYSSSCSRWWPVLTYYMHTCSCCVHSGQEAIVQLLLQVVEVLKMVAYTQYTYTIALAVRASGHGPCAQSVHVHSCGGPHCAASDGGAQNSGSKGGAQPARRACHAACGLLGAELAQVGESVGFFIHCAVVHWCSWAKNC